VDAFQLTEYCYQHDTRKDHLCPHLRLQAASGGNDRFAKLNKSATPRIMLELTMTNMLIMASVDGNVLYLVKATFQREKILTEWKSGFATRGNLHHVGGTEWISYHPFWLCLY
jgi:hypothetical protein